MKRLEKVDIAEQIVRCLVVRKRVRAEQQAHLHIVAPVIPGKCSWNCWTELRNPGWRHWVWVIPVSPIPDHLDVQHSVDIGQVSARPTMPSSCTICLPMSGPFRGLSL